MNKWVVLILLILSTNAYADYNLGIGYSVITKNSLSNEDFAVRSMFGGQFSYDWYDLNLGLELNFFEDNESEKGLASVSRSYLDLISWGRYNFINSHRVAVFFGIGSGGYQEKVKIKVQGVDTYSDRSKIHWLLSGAVGLKAKLGQFNGVVEYRISRRMAEEIQHQSIRISTNFSF